MKDTNFENADGEMVTFEPNIQLPKHIINDALAFSTEWGENFCKPIHERIIKVHPQLPHDTITHLQTYVKAAESYIYRLCELELNGELSETEIGPTAREKYPWISAGNLSRLINIGMFYARK